jgi:hypothetical protein
MGRLHARLATRGSSGQPAPPCPLELASRYRHKTECHERDQTCTFAMRLTRGAGGVASWPRPRLGVFLHRFLHRFFVLTFAVELRHLWGAPTPADARHLEVCMPGPHFLSGGRKTPASASHGVPEPPKRVPLEVCLPRGVRPRHSELKVLIIFTRDPRSFSIARCGEGRQKVGTISSPVPTWELRGSPSGQRPSWLQTLAGYASIKNMSSAFVSGGGGQLHKCTPRVSLRPANTTLLFSLLPGDI